MSETAINTSEATPNSDISAFSARNYQDLARFAQQSIVILEKNLKNIDNSVRSLGKEEVSPAKLAEFEARMKREWALFNRYSPWLQYTRYQYNLD